MANGNIFAFSQIWNKNALDSFWIIPPVPSGYARLIRMDDAKSTTFFINRQRDTAPPQKWHDTFWSFSENHENASNHKIHVRFVIIITFSFDSLKSRIGSEEKSVSLAFLVFFIFEPNQLGNQHTRRQKRLKSKTSKKRLIMSGYGLFMNCCDSNREITRIPKHQRSQIVFMWMKT